MGDDRINNNYLGTKIRVFTSVIIILSLISCLYMFISLNFGIEENNKSNLIRIEINDQKNTIKNYFEDGNYLMDEGFYNYAVVDLKGDIKYSSITEFNSGRKINIEKDIGYDNAFDNINKDEIRYSTPLVINGTQEGIIIFDLPKSILENKIINVILIPLIIFFLVIIVVSLLITRFVKDDIITPIKQLHVSAKTILKGKYDSRINYDYDGELGSFCHDFEDMRDELRISREREEKLKRDEKELLACISHDLKTPLSSISGYVEGIRDGIVKNEEGIKRYANTILKKSKELSKLIDDILEQSKTELNQMSIELKEIYSDTYFNEILSEVSLDIGAHNMMFDISADIPKALINIDTNRMNQVMNNIVANSIKYSKKGDKIEIWIEDKIDEIIVNVKDQGAGINISDIPFVFDKFYRAEKHRNTNIPGSGLGLSISKYIVEMHGGRISCKSSLGEGTIISFTIPKI